MRDNTPFLSGRDFLINAGIVLGAAANAGGEAVALVVDAYITDPGTRPNTQRLLNVSDWPSSETDLAGVAITDLQAAVVILTPRPRRQERSGLAKTPASRSASQ